MSTKPNQTADWMPKNLRLSTSYKRNLNHTFWITKHLIWTQSDNRTKNQTKPYKWHEKKTDLRSETHRWLWGAPSCRCERCDTVAPASGPCTHTSPGLPNEPSQCVEMTCHAGWLDLRGSEAHKRCERCSDPRGPKTCSQLETKKLNLIAIPNGIYEIKRNLLFKHIFI